MDDKEPPEIIAQVRVNLAFEATNALLHLADELDMTKTDVINRALQIYKYIHENEENIYIKEGKQFTRIKFD